MPAEHELVLCGQEGGPGVYRQIYYAPTLAGAIKPGQFIMLQLPGHWLRRPFGPAPLDREHLEIFVAPAGAATRELVQLPMGTRLLALGPLGHPYPLPAERALLLAGGKRAGPLVALARLLGPRATARYLPAGSGEECVYQAFQATGADFALAGASDPDLFDPSGEVYILAPDQLAMQLAQRAFGLGRSGYAGLETAMACGIGACLACSLALPSGRVRACREGAAFPLSEVAKWVP